MTVKVVTDSTADIPPEILRELDISVVPIYVVFGDKSYRDRVDMGEDEFYRRLSLDGVFPTTAVPSPKDFADVYNRLAAETGEIVSIHLTSKESGIYSSALLAREMVPEKCRIEVMDSRTISMSYGLLAMAAVREAKAGAGLTQVADVVRRSVPQMHLLFMVDTLKYVVRGGRVSRPWVRMPGRAPWVSLCAKCRRMPLSSLATKSPARQTCSVLVRSLRVL
jgi:DegV family protein with EDD domain